MRRPPAFRRLHDDEGGVTMVIVALTLIALMGMLVLVVDVGGLLWKRRELVNSADAAALAAAKTCADPDDTSIPEGQADAQAVANATGLQSGMGGVIDSGGCVPDREANGYVTVRYSQPQDLFFAPVLGFGSSSAVTTEATAAWAPLGGGKAVPIVLESSTFQGTCDVPDGVEPGDECSFWYDNGNLGSDPNTGIGGARWGFLDLQKWNVDPFDSNACNSSGGAADREDFILFDYQTPLALEDPGPTYVCSMTGAATANWQDLQDRMNGGYADWPGASILMPVNDCDKQVDRNGQFVPCGTGTPDKFAIIGFTQLRLEQILEGNDPAAIGTPGVAAQSEVCRTDLGLNDQQQRDLNVAADVDCGAPTADVDSITDISVTSGSGQGQITYRRCPDGSVTGCDYTITLDAQGHTILTWVGTNDFERKTLEFTWGIEAVAPTPGKCGVQTQDPNALCLVMVWEGFVSLGDMIPGQGPDYGVRTFVLCDFDYSSCPAGSRP